MARSSSSTASGRAVPLGVEGHGRLHHLQDDHGHRLERCGGRSGASAAESARRAGAAGCGLPRQRPRRAAAFDEGGESRMLRRKSISVSNRRAPSSSAPSATASPRNPPIGCKRIGISGEESIGQLVLGRKNCTGSRSTNRPGRDFRHGRGVVTFSANTAPAPGGGRPRAAGPLTLGRRGWCLRFVSHPHILRCEDTSCFKSGWEIMKSLIPARPLCVDRPSERHSRFANGPHSASKCWRLAPHLPSDSVRRRDRRAGQGRLDEGRSRYAPAAGRPSRAPAIGWVARELAGISSRIAAADTDILIVKRQWGAFYGTSSIAAAPPRYQDIVWAASPPISASNPRPAPPGNTAITGPRRRCMSSGNASIIVLDRDHHARSASCADARSCGSH